MYNIAPSLLTDLFIKRSPKDRFRGFVPIARNFSKCSKQIWHWLSFEPICLLMRTSHSLKSGLLFKGSRWKLIHLLESLGVLSEHPTTAHSTMLALMLSSLELRTFARNFSNNDFFLKILLVKVDELVMSEMWKNWGGHRLRFGENMPGNTRKSEKIGLC